MKTDQEIDKEVTEMIMTEVEKMKANTMKAYKNFAKDIDYDWITKYAKAQNKIMLIKAIRAFSGWGLKESKIAMETFCMDGYDFHFYDNDKWLANKGKINGSINPDKACDYFSQWLDAQGVTEEEFLNSIT